MSRPADQESLLALQSSGMNPRAVKRAIKADAARDAASTECRQVWPEIFLTDGTLVMARIPAKQMPQLFQSVGNPGMIMPMSNQ